MKKECKLVLEIAMILYIITTIISVISKFNIKALSGLNNYSSIYFSISSVILLVYVWNRGESDLAKVGFGCLIVDLIIDIIQAIFFTQLLKASDSVNTAISFVDTLSSLGLSLMTMLALFSLIPKRDSTGSKLVALAVITYIINAIIGLVLVFVKVDYSSIIYNIKSVLSNIYTLSEYGFIVYYLLNKTPNTETQLVDTTKQVETTQPPTNFIVQQPVRNVVPQQINQQQVMQPMQQQVPQQVPQQQVQQQVTPNPFL